MATVYIVYSGMPQSEDIDRVALTTQNQALANSYQLTINQMVKSGVEHINCFVGYRDPKVDWINGPRIVECCNKEEAARQTQLVNPARIVRDLDFH